jgi:hypothetical protein
MLVEVTRNSTSAQLYYVSWSPYSHLRGCVVGARARPFAGGSSGCVSRALLGGRRASPGRHGLAALLGGAVVRRCSYARRDRSYCTSTTAMFHIMISY